MRNKLLVLVAFLGLIVLSGLYLFNALKKVVVATNVSVDAVTNIQ